MPNVRLAVCAALLSLGGCVAYPAPVSYETPPPGQAVTYVGTTCSAGFYMCQVPPGPLGTQCSCPGLGAPSFGVIR